MPELPEVETMAQRLQSCVGQKIENAGRTQSVAHLARYLPNQEGIDTRGQRIEGVFRRGKFLLFQLERGALLCHNAMSGYWDSDRDPWCFDYVEGRRKSQETDIRAKIVLEGGETLQFHDMRKFGSLRYLSPEAIARNLSRLGPDALGTQHLYEPTFVITEEQFAFAIGKSKHAVKAALLEQDRIAGIGNIYAAEALWKAGIDPRREGETLTSDELERLHHDVQMVLVTALDRKLDYGALGIYRRKRCGNCQGPTETCKIGGRTTTFCPECQK